MSQLQLEDLVSGLCQEGIVDSSGRFTLDRSRALEKMRQFQLPNPYVYCLKWLQAAVAGGATHFHWNSDPKRVQVHMVGLSLEPELLPALPTLLVDDRAGPCERHLSAGINAVIRTRARELSVASWDGRRGSRAIWKSEQFEQQAWTPEESQPQVFIELLRTGLERWKEWWYAANHHYVGETRGSINARDREQKLLHHAAALAPLRVTIQGLGPDFELRASPSLRSQLLSLTMLRNPYGFRTVSVVPAEEGGFSVDRISRAGQGRPCRLFVATPHIPPEFSTLYLVRDGLMLEPERILPGQPGRVFIACARQLKVDLSGLNIVRDAHWEALVEQLSHWREGPE